MLEFLLYFSTLFCSTIAEHNSLTIDNKAQVLNSILLEHHFYSNNLTLADAEKILQKNNYIKDYNSPYIIFKEIIKGHYKPYSKFEKFNIYNNFDVCLNQGERMVYTNVNSSLPFKPVCIKGWGGKMIGQDMSISPYEFTPEYFNIKKYEVDNYNLLDNMSGEVMLEYFEQEDSYEFSHSSDSIKEKIKKNVTFLNQPFIVEDNSDDNYSSDDSIFEDFDYDQYERYILEQNKKVIEETTFYVETNKIKAFLKSYEVYTDLDNKRSMRDLKKKGEN